MVNIWQTDVSANATHLCFIFEEKLSTSYYIIVALRGGCEFIAEFYAMTNDELDVLLKCSLLCYAPVLFCSFFGGCL